MSSLQLKNIYKVYPSGVTAVTDFNLDVKDKEFIVFVGPSGCGKSTTLRMIAGLEEITKGELYIDGNLVNNVAPKDRDIAMVFQNYALYPHMSVYENMAFGLKLRKMPRAEINKRVKEAARILGIEMYLSRKPKALSGGQRQRVALGRAIVREPKVFLLDEPLSNLDAKLRSQMRSEITKLHNRLATTFIYVTHDQIEAMTMGTRIVVMKDGFMQQVDTPINLYDHPMNLFVAGFIGTPQMNFFTGKLVGTKDKVSFTNGTDKIAIPKNKVDLIVNLSKYLNTGKEVVFGIRPEDLSDDPKLVKSTNKPVVKLKVDTVEALGSETLLYCKFVSQKAKEGSFLDDVANITAKVDSRSLTKANSVVDVVFDVDQCHIFDKQTEITIIAKDENNKKMVEEAQIKMLKDMAERELAAQRKANMTKAEKKLEKKRLKLEAKQAKLNPKPVSNQAVTAPVKQKAEAPVVKNTAPVKAPSPEKKVNALPKAPVAKKPVASPKKNIGPIKKMSVNDVDIKPAEKIK